MKTLREKNVSASDVCWNSFGSDSSISLLISVVLLENVEVSSGSEEDNRLINCLSESVKFSSVSLLLDVVVELVN